MSCGIGCRRDSGLALLGLWYRLAATAPIRPLVWDPAYAMGVALKRQKNKKQKKHYFFQSMNLAYLFICVCHLQFLSVIGSISINVTHHTNKLIQSTLTALKILCALPIHPFLSLNHWQPLIFFTVS